jgi:hypothetical protein
VTQALLERRRAFACDPAKSEMVGVSVAARLEDEFLAVVRQARALAG